MIQHAQHQHQAVLGQRQAEVRVEIYGVNFNSGMESLLQLSNPAHRVEIRDRIVDRLDAAAQGLTEERQIAVRASDLGDRIASRTLQHKWRAAADRLTERR